MPSKEPMLTIRDVAADLRIEPNTLRIWIRSKKFPGWIKVGRQWRLSPDRLEKFKAKANHSY